MNSKCEQCIVRQLNALKHLTKDELKRLSGCKTTKTLHKGDTLFDEGDYINGVFCIKKGVCKVSKKSDNGKDQIVFLVKKGDILGERSLVSNENSKLKATAVNDMEVCFIPKTEVVTNLENNNRYALNVLKEMAESLKTAETSIVNMAQKTLKQRLAGTILMLHDKFDLNNDDVINISLSREDIANIVGAATESTIRLLSEFKKEELISFKGKEIKVLNKQGLLKIADNL